MQNTLLIDRRRLLLGAGVLAMAPPFPAWAQSGHGGHGRGAAPLAGRDTGGTLSGETIRLEIGEARFAVGDRSASAIAINGTIPAPLIRLREGQSVKIAVTNRLKEQSSIHWHGLLVPFQMDGVPGLSFPGIDPGETFTYEFPVRHSGTFWYHSHSGMQEAVGLYGPILIDPAEPDTAVPFDREYVLVLADWSPVDPHIQLQKLKTMGGYYNWQRQTVGGLLKGQDQSLSKRMAWAKMRMDATDISDVTGATYSFLINGHDTLSNWTALFRPGERVKLRIINASSMTNFNVRIPGLPMAVVAADGCNVAPVETDEIQIAIAETYDVIVQPSESAAFGIIAEAIDRSGLVRATLAPQIGMVGPVPPLRSRPILTMRDMGMDMSGMEMDGMAGHSMQMRDLSLAPGVKPGPGVATIAAMPADRLADRPTGLEDADHRVLTYADLRSREANPDLRQPARQIDVNLTANMERYMWSIDGQTISDGAQPIPFRKGERVRVNLINHTMMPHPIHLHGHFFELVTGEPGNRPRKHTVNVLPGGKCSFDLTADAEGDWAFHCHMLLHMHAGMMRVVTVRAEGEAA